MVNETSSLLANRDVNHRQSASKDPIIVPEEEDRDDTIIPPSVRSTHINSLAIPACYLTVGVIQGLSGPLLNVYPLDLGASEAAQVTFSNMTNFPGTLKIVFGFLSDNTLGGKRKPYMLMGWITVAGTMGYLLCLSGNNLGMSYNEEHKPIPPADAPGIQELGLLFFLLGLGLWFADAMGDALVAEKAKMEPPRIKGRLQSTCYACRFFGMMVAAPIATYLYSSHGPKSVVMGLCLAPLLVLPLLPCLKEDPKTEPSKSTSDRVGDIWATVQSRSVWQPMAFVYLYNLLQVGNGAWRQFLKTVLLFTEAQLNYLLVAAYIFLFLGTILYKECFLKASWRKVYLACISLNWVLSALQFLLIYGKTFGVSPFWFAFGDDAFGEIVQGVQFLPTAIMMVDLCPEGSEGASYALFTTFNNSAIMASSAIGTMMLGIWDVAKDTLAARELSGFIKLTLLTTVLQLSPILFLSWLPHGKKELKEMATLRQGSSTVGGFLFLMVAFVSVLYTLIVGTISILHPDWITG